MPVERTLSIIKPDAVAKNVIGKIYSRFESNGLAIVAAQMRRLSRADAEGFYAVHRGRPFFDDLVEFMTSGPVMIQVLEGESAIAKNRDLMGATDPKKGRGRHDSRGFRDFDRRQRCARLGCRRHGEGGDRVLLPGARDPQPLGTSHARWDTMSAATSRRSHPRPCSDRWK